MIVDSLKVHEATSVIKGAKNQLLLNRKCGRVSPVRYDHSRAVGAHLGQRSLNVALCLGVQGRGGLEEDAL